MNIAEAVGAEHARWDAFVNASSTGSFLQMWEWGEMHRELGRLFWRVIIEHNGTIVATALVLRRGIQFGYSWLYVPYGPVFVDGLSKEEQGHVWKLFEEKLTSLVKESGAFFVRIDPLWETSQDSYVIPKAWRKSAREVQPQHTLLLSLTPDEATLQAQLHSKTRYNIKVAQKKGVVISYSKRSGIAHGIFISSRRILSRDD
jgi:peptidoglycan pentaglycine glycine transferase (the first glycine)